MKSQDFQNDQENPQKKQEEQEWLKSELGEMHLLLSEKYREYRDLVERCFLNPQTISNGERRVFYLEPNSPFLMEPRMQNQMRHDFINKVSQVPSCQPLTLMADELHRTYLEHIADKSDPDILRRDLVQHFKRTQLKLQHKRYKMMLRWAHHCLTSDRVDQVSLSFNSKYTKLQFELENCVKRVQRLDGQDHFKETKRPQPAQDLGFRLEDNHDPISVLRHDDIDVYLRQVSYEQKISRIAERFIQRSKWLPLSHRFQLYKQSVYHVQEQRRSTIDAHDEYVAQIQQYGEKLSSERSNQLQGDKEVNQIISQLHISRLKQRQKTLSQQIFESTKFDYALPPIIFRNEIELKLELNKIAAEFGKQGNLEIDNGHSFQYSISVFFPTEFSKQTLLLQFVPYDVVNREDKELQQIQSQIAGSSMSKHRSSTNDYKSIKGKSRHTDRSLKNGLNFGSTGMKSLFKSEKLQQIERELRDQPEKGVLGDLNNGQTGYPVIRVKKSEDWLDLISFQPDIDHDQKHQACLLSCEKNSVDKILEKMISMVDVHDPSSLTAMLETLAKMQSEKVQTGKCIIDFEDKEEVLDLTFFTEDQKSLLNLYQNSLKVKSLYDNKTNFEQRDQNSFFNIPAHLVSAMNQLLTLRLRNSKIKLLHTLNAFRSIQRRLTYDVREMGTRDRVLGDVRFMKRKGPSEGRSTLYEPPEDKQREELYKNIDFENGMLPKCSINDLVKVNCDEAIDITKDSLVDINKYRFDGRFVSHYYSTCPIVPHYHQSFGQPVDRQEASAHFEITHNKDVRRDETEKLVGRQDMIYKHKQTDLTLVKDDFDVNILYDASFKDLITLENEVLKICSFYINKIEPILDRGDYANIYPLVDRLRIIDEALQLEVQYQEEKLLLIQTYLECYEHVSDILCQQRMLQIMVDEMARRPRLNLQSTHFKQSYEIEIECLKERTCFLKEVIRVLLQNEFQENTLIREYIEKTYRLLHDQMENKWNYVRPEKKEMELNKRQQIQTGIVGTRDGSMDQKLDQVGNIIQRTTDEINQMKEKIEAQTSTIFQKKYTDPKEFANILGMPYSSLQMLMKEHHERDPLVRTSIHEHVSFIKIQEGYPQFLYKTNVLQNLIKLNPDSETIGILDFYESFHVVPKIISSIQLAMNELQEFVRPPNGQMTSSLELFLLKEMKNQFRISTDNLGYKHTRPKGIEYIEDDSVLGNPDKIMFFSKEMQASIEDEEAAYNPFVISKLDLDIINKFNFNKFEGYIEIIKSPQAQESDEEMVERRAKVNQQSFSRFYPMLKVHNENVKFPSLLVLTCNSVEVVRLRNLLITTMEQAFLLRNVYKEQVAAFQKEFHPTLREPFKFDQDMARPLDKQVNFVNDGPARGLGIQLAINEFDTTLGTSLNFMDSECFKSCILPLGLEELRSVVHYEIINLQALIVAVRTNQQLLDSTERQLCEMEFLQNNFFVSNPVFNLNAKLSGTNMVESNIRKLTSKFTTEIQAKLVSNVSPLAYSVVSKKLALKSQIEKQYLQFKDQINKINQEEELKYELQQRILKNFRVYLCYLYGQDLQIRFYNDSIKLQCLYEVDRIRKRSHMIPKDANIFKANTLSPSGEHAFAFYTEGQEENSNGQPINESKQMTTEFYDTVKETILDVWRLPTNMEILSLQQKEDDIIKQNKLLMNLPTPSEWSQATDSAKFIKKFTPTLTLIQDNQIQATSKGRLANFKEAHSHHQSSIALKYLRYWRAASDIFDLEFFQNKLQSTSFVACTIEKHILSGNSFWDSSNEFAEDNAYSSSEEECSKGLNGSSFQADGHKPNQNVLANQVAEKMAQERRDKVKLIQDLEAVADRFKTYELIITQQEMTHNIHRAANFLQEIHKITYYGLIHTLHQCLDQFLREENAQKEINHVCELLRHLTNTEDVKVTLSNGFHVNRSVSSIDRLDLEGPIMTPEYSQYFKASQSIIDEEALNPPEYNLIQHTLQFDHGDRGLYSRPANFAGSLRGIVGFGRVYQCLDYSLLSLHKNIRKLAQSNLMSLEGSLKAYVRQKNKFMEENDCLDSPLVYSQMMEDKQSFLRMIIRQRQLKRCLIMLMNKQTIPQNVEEFRKVTKQCNDYIQWRLLQNSKKISKSNSQNINQHTGHQLVKKVQENIYGPGGSIKLAQDQAAKRMFFDASQEVDQVQHEIQKYMVSSSLFLIKRESAALIKAFEMSNVKMQALIHPIQQFASTFQMKIDNRNHLDIINKVPAIQKMYTQIQNRSLEVQTLTSGVGVIITKKDLNECLDECCRSLVQFSEIEMRTRCEHLSMYIASLKQHMYRLDRQNELLSSKLALTSEQIDKIVTSRMFSTCKDLVYELDQANRQLRFLKDSIYTMESKLTEKIHICYDKEIQMKKANLEQLKAKFFNYQDGLSANVKALVRNEVNNIDNKLKETTKKFQDLEKKTKMQIEEEQFEQQAKFINHKPKQNPVILASQIKKGSKAQLNKAKEDQMHDLSAGTAKGEFMHSMMLKKARRELEILRQNEKEARDEVIRLQDLFRQQKTMYKIRFVTTHEKHLKEIDHLKRQKTENQVLWDKLAESENRENILKKEIEKTHLQIANQDKIMDKLKEELKKASKENYKLIQFKETHGKKLQDLEDKARDLEVLQGLDIQKIIALLEKQDGVISTLRKEESRMASKIDYLQTAKEQDSNQIKMLALEESKFKNQAFHKLEMIRQELKAQNVKQSDIVGNKQPSTSAGVSLSDVRAIEQSGESDTNEDVDASLLQDPLKTYLSPRSRELNDKKFWQNKLQNLHQMCVQLREQKSHHDFENYKLKAQSQMQNGVEAPNFAQIKRAAATPLYHQQVAKTCNSVDRLQVSKVHQNSIKQQSTSTTAYLSQIINNDNLNNTRSRLQSDARGGSSKFNESNYFVQQPTSLRFKGFDHSQKKQAPLMNHALDPKTNTVKQMSSLQREQSSAQQLDPSKQVLYQTLSMYPSSQSIFYRAPQQSTLMHTTTSKQTANKLPTIIKQNRSHSRLHNIPVKNQRVNGVQNHNAQNQQQMHTALPQKSGILSNSTHRDQQNLFASFDQTEYQSLPRETITSTNNQSKVQLLPNEQSTAREIQITNHSQEIMLLPQKRPSMVKITTGPNIFATLQKNSLESVGSGSRGEDLIEVTNDQENDDRSLTGQTQTGNFEPEEVKGQVAQQ